MSQTILVAEDDDDQREAVAWSLRSQGFRVVTAADGMEALRALRGALPHLAILDVRMPWIGGLELVQHMRSDARLRRIPVVMLTAYADEVPRDLTVISKPFDAHRLMATVEAILGLRGGWSRALGDAAGDQSDNGGSP